ncbi:EpsG family protein [Niameybacter massiliensis]|uniref:EpsG family protein n=1 Tax=Niameybacter massiliensis TaxID=1658108 RepID=UPI0006B5B484|nr:EpsG family protein [Niameybacter massiliensis]
MITMPMVNVYFCSMFLVLLIGHYGINNKVQSKLLVAVSLSLIFAILFIVSGFRTGVGDTYFYKHSYEIVGEKLAAGDMEGIKTLFAEELGFNALMVGLNYITPDPQILVLVMAFITNILNLKSIYKYARPFELGIYLYFATVIFYVTMNGMRQAFVASIFFCLGIQLIKKQKFFRYVILTLFLATFHNSALIFIPLYFIGKKEAWGKLFWWIAGFFIAATTAFRPFMPMVVEMLEGGRYDAYAQDMASGGEGVNTIRILIMLVPLVLAYLVKDDLKQQWEDSSLFIFMSLLNFGFMLLASQYLYFYRVCIYFELFNLALIPRCLGCLKGKISRIAYVYLIGFYALFCYYQVAITWGGNYTNIILGNILG